MGPLTTPFNWMAYYGRRATAAIGLEGVLSPTSLFHQLSHLLFNRQRKPVWRAVKRTAVLFLKFLRSVAQGRWNQLPSPDATMFSAGVAGFTLNHATAASSATSSR